MAEGPVNFGKPVAILVLLGCIGGGYYANKNWPYTYEQLDGQSYWSVKFPNSWTSVPAGDPQYPTKVNFSGPLSETVSGTGWAMTLSHGTLVWPEMVVDKVGGTVNNIKDPDIDNKKSIMYDYEDNVTKFLGCAVERGDVLVYVHIGCPKANFEEFRERFEKVLKSLKCHR